jgi:hypothetical protein
MQTVRGQSRKFQLLAAAVLAASPAVAPATITIDHSSSVWTITNGDLTVKFDTGKKYITSVQVGVGGAAGANILDPSKSNFDPEYAGTPFGAGTVTASFDQKSNYIDFWTTTQSTGTTVNPITYSFHYVMFDNDPAVHVYEYVSHSATDPATNVGQGQFLLRLDPSKFSTLYQENTSVNNLGPTVTTLPSTPAQLAALNGTTGYGDKVVVGTNTFNPRQDLAEVLDLNGDNGTNGTQNLEGLIGRNFLNKYDYSAYQQLENAKLEYGSQYVAAQIYPTQETLDGGPTKQDLQFTNNILMAEFLSGHYGASDYGYTPPQGVASSKLWGPYTFRITSVNGESGAQLYQDATNSAAAYPAMWDTDTTLVADGYVPTTQRGILSANIGSSVGWSSNALNNTIVLSDPEKNFQRSGNGATTAGIPVGSGYQYWTQLDTSGHGTITGVVPGTYRMSIYQYGQWGETRIDNVQVQANKISIPQNARFVPENFGTAPPIFTIGTPDRSANEFLNGHFTTGPQAGFDDRNYFGNYDYWQEEADLGNPGKVVYYGTAVGSTPATNDPNKWIANQWGTFNPALFDPATNSNQNTGAAGLYASTAPAYVRDAAHGGTGPGPATYSGAPWEIHFTTTAAQTQGKSYVILSVGLAAVESSLIMDLNGIDQRIYHRTNTSDAMVRSGDAGYYQWLAVEWPVSALSASGADDVIHLSVNSADGVMYDALRLEITSQSANPSVTGWHDYEYINSNGSANAADANDALGLAAQNDIVNLPEPAMAFAFIAAGTLLSIRRTRKRANA